ncbi:MAG TPA: hypothetical protein ENJ82_05820 [Bacteroidetes bacterium]|nr:hypothetical protein [Bacteroidota bacterium]
MKMKILFPTEFGELGEKARLQAAFLARALKGELHIMHSVSKPGALVRLISGDHLEEEKEEAAETLEAYATALAIEGKVPVFKMIWDGAPAHAIVEAAHHIKADIIIFGTLGGAGLRDTLLGSSVNYVIRNAPCPVLTIRNQPQVHGFKKILVPIDTLKEVLEQVKWGVKMAILFGAEIHFLGLMTGDPEHNRQIDFRVRNAVKYAHAEGVEIAEMHLDPQYESTVSEIEQIATAIHADLICVVTQSEDEKGVLTMLGGGSIADRVVNTSQFPIFSVPANGH